MCLPCRTSVKKAGLGSAPYRPKGPAAAPHPPPFLPPRARARARIGPFPPPGAAAMHMHLTLLAKWDNSS